MVKKNESFNLSWWLCSRLSEYTDVILNHGQIGGIPIIWHIMNRYSMYGFKDLLLP